MRVTLDSVLRVRGRESSVKRLVERSPVPMTIVDRTRRHVDANATARLALQIPLKQLREMQIDDITPRRSLPVLEEAWERLTATGHDFGDSYEVVSPAGSRLDATYFALANALPGLALIAFAPVAWPEDELLDGSDHPGTDHHASLTARELEVLQLAADGHTAKAIAAELVVSPATVRTHLTNIYAKLRVRDRAAAVARGLRLGVIT